MRGSCRLPGGGIGGSEEDDRRRTADWRVPTGGIDIEAARIIAARPLFVDQLRMTGPIDAKNGDRVVEPVGGIDERSVRRDHDFRSEIRTDEAFGKRGYLVDKLQGAG